MKLEEIKELIAVAEKSQFKKFSIKRDNFELHLEKEGQVVPIAEKIVLPQVEVSSKKVTDEKKVEGKYIKSPMVGTLYLSSAPGQPSFIKQGDVVNENTIVCIIEAMKVMNEIKAGMKGVVVEVLCENAHPVEFGSKLFRVE